MRHETAERCPANGSPRILASMPLTEQGRSVENRGLLKGDGTSHAKTRQEIVRHPPGFVAPQGTGVGRTTMWKTC